MNLSLTIRSVLRGILAFLILISLYFLILTLVSGWKFTWEQFSQFWYYVVSLALGFGIQFSLYSYLKGVIKQKAASGKVLTTTGATSTGAMISCCAHYLVNLLPILGVTGIITFISQYQVQFFWLGLFFNLLGIFYIGNKVVRVTKAKISRMAILYGGLLAVIAGFIFLNNFSIKINSKGTDEASSVSMRADGNSLETKENSDGPIAISVTPQGLTTNSQKWDFEIGLNTHSGSLDTDLVTVSELIDDQGKSYKPTSWEGSPLGGHHRSGVLKFNAISPRPKSIELKIKNVGGISERSFKWGL